MNCFYHFFLVKKVTMLNVMCLLYLLWNYYIFEIFFIYLFNFIFDTCYHIHRIGICVYSKIPV